MPTETQTPKPTLSTAAQHLLFIAARSHSLREQMGIELVERDDTASIKFRPGVPRPWLVGHPTDRLHLTFSPDIYAKTLGRCSDGEHWMRLWILNVWNPSYARTNGWTFDFFKAFRVLDSGNLEAIAWLCQNPVLP